MTSKFAFPFRSLLPSHLYPGRQQSMVFHLSVDLGTCTLQQADIVLKEYRDRRLAEISIAMSVANSGISVAFSMAAWNRRARNLNGKKQ